MESSNNTPALYDVLKQFEVIRVDDYQRTYAWTRDEIVDLFDDLKDCADSDEFHFFGTLIFQSSSSSEATIVDGQQRLTTVFVLMSALRDEIAKLGMDTLPAGAGRPLPIPVVNKTWEFLYADLDPTKPRFKSNRFLTSIFTKSVYADVASQQKIADRDSQLSLAFRKAVKVVRALVSEDLERFQSIEEKLVRVNSLIDALRERFLVLRIMTSNLSESLEIFLTLNNRGLPLGASDLVRGEILAKLGEGEEEREQARLHQQIFEEWSDIAENVHEVEVFLRHYLVASGTAKVQKKKVFDTVANRLKDPSPEIRKLKAKELWKDLQNSAEIYNAIISPKMGGDTEYYLDLLHGLMKSHRILFLTVLSLKLSPELNDKIARQVAVLCFRWVMSGGNAQKLEDLFQTMGKNLKVNGNVEALLDELAARASEISPDTVARHLREDADEGYIGKAILHAINRARTPGANPIKLASDIHLEHVAPQTPTDHWKAQIFAGDSSRYGEYDAEISQIGNLTLLDFKLNISAKQKPFVEKLEKYGNSVIKITNDLNALHAWDAEDISLRTDYVIEAFNKVFSIEASNEPVQPFGEWLKNRSL